MDLILVSIHCRYALDGVKGQREGLHAGVYMWLILYRSALYCNTRTDVWISYYGFFNVTFCVLDIPYYDSYDVVACM